MKNALLIAALFLVGLGAVLPSTAEARVFVSARFGGGYGGYYPYGYPGYYYPYYVEPPPVVYAVPPAPSAYYEEAAPTVVTQSAPVVAAAPAPVASKPSSTTFIDSAGRTCRHYEGPAPGSLNTACLQPDGSWRAVQ